MTTRLISKCMPVLALAGAILLSLSPRADALLQTSASIAGEIVAACDQNPTVCGPAGALVIPDVNPTVGILSTNGFTAGGVAAEFAIQTSTKSTAPGGLNTLSSAGTVIQNISAVAIPIFFSVGDTNFLGPASQFTTTGSGTWVDQTLPADFGGSTIAMQWFNDPANAQGADAPTDLPGNPLVAPLASDTPADGTSNQSFGGPATEFNTSGALANPDPALFSMTLFTDLVLGPGIRLESRGQAESKPQGEIPPVVPAPATLLLLGSALGLLGWRRWKSPA